MEHLEKKIVCMTRSEYLQFRYMITTKMALYLDELLQTYDWDKISQATKQMEDIESLISKWDKTFDVENDNPFVVEEEDEND